MNYVRERQNGLDVTQEVFLKAYNPLESVTAEGMFKPWLLRITYTESINWVRKHKRTYKRRRVLPDPPDRSALPGQTARSDIGTPVTP